MEFIWLPVFIFLELVKILIFIEIIFSFLSLLGIHIAIPFIHTIVQPLFVFIRKNLPVQFFGLDFSPIILLILINLSQRAIINVSPEIVIYLPQLGFL
jgi:uncharacterized protein YggT (Ycf19 family)